MRGLVPSIRLLSVGRRGWSPQGRPWRGWCPRTYPRRRNPCLSSAHLIPRGGHPEACCMAGWGRRPAAGFAPRTREAAGTALGI